MDIRRGAKQLGLINFFLRTYQTIKHIMDSQYSLLRVYGRSELARLYYGRPISDRSARRWFQNELSCVPGLMERLRELGYSPKGKIFSRAQVKAIFDALGEP